MIDSHVHLDQMPEETIQDHLKILKDLGVLALGVGGTDPENFDRSVELKNAAEKFGVNCQLSVGLHPWWVEKIKDEEQYDFKMTAIESLLIQHPNLWIGEMGLDSGKKRGPHFFDLALRAYKDQLHLSKKYRRPMVMHWVYEELRAIEVMSEVFQGARANPFLVHSFGGDQTSAKIILEKGGVISLSARRILSPSRQVEALIKALPVDRLLIETDAEDTVASMKIVEAYERVSLIHREKPQNLIQIVQKTWDSFLRFR